MNTTRYRFSSFISHDDLCILAVLAKELLQENDKIFQIFSETNEYLQGDSSSRATSLMIRNNRSIFTSSPNKESYLINALSLRGLTSITRNPETLNKARRVLPLGDAERAHHSKSEPSTPVRRHTVIISPKNKAFASPSIGDAGTEDEKFACEFDFTGSPGAKEQDSPRSAEITKIATNLTMSEEVFKSPVKVTGTFHKVSSPSVEVSVIAQNLTMVEKDTSSPVKEVTNQISSQSAEKTRMTSSLRVEDKESKTLSHDEEIAGKSVKNAEFFNQEKGNGKFYGTDEIKKDYTSHTQEIAQISKPTMAQIPSPAKRPRMNDESAANIEASASPNKNFRIIKDSPKMNKVTINPNLGEKFIASPGDASKVIVKGVKKRNTTIFKSVPKVVKLPGESDIDIEVLYKKDDNARPSTSKSLPSDYGRGSVRDISISPVASSNTKTFPKRKLEPYLCFTESATSICSPGNASKSKTSDNNDSPSTSKSSQADNVRGSIKDFNISPAAGSSETKTIPKSIHERCLRSTESATPQADCGSGSIRNMNVSHVAGPLEIKIFDCILERWVRSNASAISSANYGSNSIKDTNIIHAAGSSETKVIPTNIPERHLRSTESETPICVSGNVSKPNSPVSSDDFLSANSPSDISSEEEVTTSDQSSECASSIASGSNNAGGSNNASGSNITSGSNIATNTSLVQTIMRFNALLASREQFMQKMHRSLLNFQNNLQFSHNYVQNLGNIALRIAISNKEYSTTDVKETVHEIGALALKLKDKLELWKRFIDSDVEMWEKFSLKIKHLKTLYEPLLTNEGTPAASSRTVQSYEFEIKAKWRRMDEIILTTNSKMNSFFYTAYDVEKLINLFVQCLILVGILQPR